MDRQRFQLGKKDGFRKYEIDPLDEWLNRRFPSLRERDELIKVEDEIDALKKEIEHLKMEIKELRRS